MEHLEAIGKIFAIVGTTLLGLLLVLKCIEKIEPDDPEN